MNLKTRLRNEASKPKLTEELKPTHPPDVVTSQSQVIGGPRSA